MKGLKSFLPVVLFILAAVFLIAGTVYYIWEKSPTGFRSSISDTSVENEETVSEDEELSEEPETVSKDAEEEQGIVDSEQEFVCEEPEPEPEPEPEIEYEDNPYNDYFSQNSDMIAWINIPDTIVDYPVMWTPEDENYYLYRGFNKKKVKGGCLILDTDSSVDPYTTNLIIHGHKNPHQMFGELDQYESEDYRDSHPYIYLSTISERKVYEVIAAFRSQVFYTTDVCFKYYKFFNAANEDEFNDFYNNVIAMSYYSSDDLNAQYGDHFLTLSTCSYHVENGRFVVVAKEIDTDKFYKNSEETKEDVTNEKD